MAVRGGERTEENVVTKRVRALHPSAQKHLFNAVDRWREGTAIGRAKKSACTTVQCDVEPVKANRVRVAELREPHDLVRPSRGRVRRHIQVRFCADTHFVQ